LTDTNGVLITWIQRFSINDGPGIRTNVFIKGCPLHCPWCHNPECISQHTEIYWKPKLCQQCGLCLEVCPSEAIRAPVDPEEAINDPTYNKIIREKCDLCMKCVEACPYHALAQVGEPSTPEEVIKEAARDIPFYKNSGGGLTITGGEPFTQPRFVGELARLAKTLHIHTCVDTSGYVRWEVVKDLMEDIDMFLFDIKHMDTIRHSDTVGVPNDLSLENLSRLSAEGKEIRIRIPVIPDFNDDLENMARMAGFLKNLPTPVSGVDLLPFHNWCQEKYRWLDLPWRMDGKEGLLPEQLDPLKELLENEGITTTIGG